MAFHHIYNYIGRFLIACIAVTGLLASEHHGVVTSGGIPVPGAAVTATMGDKKQVTTTDDQGAYSFPDLDDGNWSLTIDMLGFTKVITEVGVAPGAPGAQWEMRMLTPDLIKADVAARLAPPPAPAAATPASATPAPAGTTTAATPPTTPATPAASTTPGATPAAAAANTPAAGRGNAAGRGAASANGGRPSIRAAQQNGGFQRADVTQQADVGGAGAGADMGNVDMSQAGDAMVAMGSVNTGLGMPQQNDWGMGRGGDGMGGPGGLGMGGPGGMGGDGTGLPGQQGADTGGGGRGGRGGGGPGGGGPGGGGGRGGGGGGLGGGVMPMAPGGRGGRGGGGPGGRGGRGNPNSFGNGRRGARPRYNANLAFVLDNSALDARSYSISGADTAKAAYAKARVTASGGGPLKIPHVLAGDKTTFFLNYQLTRNRNGSTGTGLMPTAAERGGDFSQAVNSTGPVSIFDPLSGLPFPGNVIPQNRISSQAAALMSFYPQPNFAANTRFNYQIPIVGITNQDNISTRISEALNQKNQFTFGLGYQRSDTTNPNIFEFVDKTHMIGINANASWIFHITPRTMNTVRYTFSRSNTQATPFFANKTNIALQDGILGTNQDPLNYGPPSLSFTNFQGLSDANESVNKNNTSSGGDTVMWIHGLHTVQIGGDLRRQDLNPLSQQNARGSFTFNGTVTGQLVNGLPVSGTGYDFADFLLGYADTTAIAYGNADKYFRTTWVDGFVNDDWRINTQLSLVSGMRWEYATPVTEIYGRMVNLNIGPEYSSITPVCAELVANTKCSTTASQVGLPNSLVNSTKGGFEPRIGFAYRPFPKASTLIRGGYGIYYNTSVYSSIANQMAQQSPISTSARLSSTPTNLLTLATGLQIPANTTTNTFAIDPNFRIGYSQNWQVAIQQNLKWSLVGTITYSGSKGTRLAQQFLPNSVPNGFVASNPLVPGPFGPSGYTFETSNGDNTYHSVIFQLQRRFRSGFSGNVLYVHNKAIDDALGTVVAQNWLNLDGERARSSGIRADTLNLSMQYSTGVGTRGGTLLKGWKGTLIKDWTMVTNITVAGGAPLNPLVPLTVKGTGVSGSERPNLTGLSIYDTPLGFNLNPAAFVSPAPGTWGSLGRNSIEGPGQFSLNGSASRTIRIGERRSADLQFNASNLLNHVTITGWGTTVGSSQFGLATNASGMRVIQATLRFRF